MSEVIYPDDGNLLLSQLQLNSPAQVNRSAWTGRRQVVGLAGTETWTGSAEIDLLTTENMEQPWRAFLFALGGPQNWFRWNLPRQMHIGPKPSVVAGAGNGKSLALEGMQPNARILKAGQYLTVPLPSGHHRTVVLTADLSANGGGNATAQFSPALNEAPATGVEVETARPFIPMSPVGNQLGLATSDGVSRGSFEVEEAL